MSNLFRQYVESKPVRASLSFGHNLNVIIGNVDFEERKGKDTTIRANTFITLQQVDPVTRDVKAKFEGSFWDIDPVSDMLVSGFNNQLTILTAIVSAVGGDVEEFIGNYIDASGIEDGVVTKKNTSTKKEAKTVQDALQTAFKTAIDGKIGENCPLLKCKLVSNKKGFLEFGKEVDWILPMDSDEDLPEVTSKEREIYDAAQSETRPSQVEPDAVGSAPVPSGEAKVAPPTFDSI